MPNMTIQGAFTSGELAPSLFARADLDKYSRGCKTLKNFTVQPHGGAIKRSGFLLVDALPGEAALVRFVFNARQSYVLCFGDYWLRVATPQGMVLGTDGKPCHIATPYSLEQAKSFSSTQSADVLFLAHQEVRPHKLKRLGHSQWEFEAVSFLPGIEAPSGLAAVYSGGSGQTVPYSYTVTAVDAQSRESDASPLCAISGQPSNNWHAGTSINLSWKPVPGADEYRVYKASYGGRPGWIGSVLNGSTSFSDCNNAPLGTDGPPKHEDPFAGGDYPGLVGIFEQRLVYASTPKRPQTLWMSCSGDYSNFATSSPVEASDSIELTIASQEVSPLLWMVELNRLILGALGVEWEIASAEGAFTAKTAQAKAKSQTGSAAIDALVINNTVLHVARSARMVRSIRYDAISETFEGQDLTILSNHLFTGRRIMEWAYQAAPDSVVWAVRDDGVLLGLTFHAEHQVCAWHQHHTQGRFLHVASIPDRHDDTLFAVVERFGRMFLEQMAPQYEGGDLKDSCFLDCAQSYKGQPISTISGLEHLEGQLISIMADGAELSAYTVQGGTVTLPRPASNITVGLLYNAQLETMPADFMGNEGSTTGRKKKINAVSVLVKDSVLALIGTDTNKLEKPKWRTNEHYGEVIQPFSGTKRVVVPTLAEQSVSVCIRSASPHPLCVLAIMPEVEVL